MDSMNQRLLRPALAAVERIKPQSQASAPDANPDVEGHLEQNEAIRVSHAGTLETCSP